MNKSLLLFWAAMILFFAARLARGEGLAPAPAATATPTPSLEAIPNPGKFAEFNPKVGMTLYNDNKPVARLYLDGRCEVMDEAGAKQSMKTFYDYQYGGLK